MSPPAARVVTVRLQSKRPDAPAIAPAPVAPPSNRAARTVAAARRPTSLDEIFGPAKGQRPRPRRVRPPLQAPPRQLPRSTAVDPIAQAADEAIAAAIAQAEQRRRGPPRRRSRATLQPKPVRPTLSEQLATIGDQAACLTRDIRRQHLGDERCRRDGPEPLLRVPALGFHVGHLACRFPSPVEFFSDRAAYHFMHPFEAKEITMVMFYRDMRQVTLRSCSRELAFKIDRVLEQFNLDYDPSDRTHFVKITLASGSDFAALAALGVLPGVAR